MKQDYFVVYSRILMGSGFAVRGFLGARWGRSGFLRRVAGREHGTVAILGGAAGQ